MPARLFVGNLSYDVTETELKELFSSVGSVSSVYLPLDRTSGKPRGFAFVEFADPEQGEEAIRTLNNQVLKGRPLTVKEALERGQRPQPRPARSEEFRPSAPAPDFSSFETPQPGAPDRSSGSESRRGKDRKKNKSVAKTERGPKKPIPTKGGGRFFEMDYDEDYSAGQALKKLRSRHSFNDDEIG